jgi:hypothetical protein
VIFEPDAINAVLAATKAALPFEIAFISDDAIIAMFPISKKVGTVTLLPANIHQFFATAIVEVAISN